MYEKSRYFTECNIAGFTYYDGLKVMDKLKLNTELSLECESENPHDPDAIAIYYGEAKLGYIPQAQNKIICHLLYFGHSDVLEAKISYVNLENPAEQQFRITVYYTDKRPKKKALK